MTVGVLLAIGSMLPAAPGYIGIYYQGRMRVARPYGVSAVGGARLLGGGTGSDLVRYWGLGRGGRDALRSQIVNSVCVHRRHLPARERQARAGLVGAACSVNAIVLVDNASTELDEARLRKGYPSLT